MIVFCHIPKTAGTTLNVLLRRHFGHRALAGRARREDRYTLDDLQADMRVYRKIAVLSGHALHPWVDFGPHTAEMRWITFLRDPTSTLVSLYVHQFTSKLPEHDKFKMPFEEWLETYPRRNRQTKWIARTEDIGAAKAMLRDRMAFVGFTEQFDPSLLLMRQQLGLPSMDLRYERKMVVRDKSLAKQVRAKIDADPERFRHHLEADQELYRFAREELWPEYVNAFGGTDTLERATRDLVAEREGYREPWVDAGHIAYRVKNNLLYKPFHRLTRG